MSEETLYEGIYTATCPECRRVVAGMAARKTPSGQYKEDLANEIKAWLHEGLLVDRAETASVTGHADNCQTYAAACEEDDEDEDELHPIRRRR